MDIPTLKTSAAEHLAAAPYSPRKLTLLHTGGALGLSLILTIANYLLTKQIDTTGGLAGIGTRTVLSAIQMFLSIAGAAVIPFWEFGYFRAALNISRREPAQPTTLLEGFRRFGPVLRLLLLRGALFMTVAFLCLQGAATIFTMTPLSNSFMEAAESIIEAGTSVDPAVLDGLMVHMIPMYVLWAVLLCVILIPLMYRYRLADWAVMDDTFSARAAMKKSKRWMFLRRKKLFQLDLHFWWYYALQLLAGALAYGDEILSLLGISLRGDWAFFGFYLLSMAVQLVTAWRFAPQIQTTYAIVYDTFRKP